MDNKPSLMERIAARHVNNVTAAKFMLSEATRMVEKAQEWKSNLSSLSRYQMVAMLHIVSTMRSNVNTMKALIAFRASEDELEALDVQAEILQGIVEDVTDQLRLVGDDIDTVLVEMKPTEIAAIVLDQALQNQAILNPADIRDIQMSGDFTGLIQYLVNHEPMSIVAALMQTPGDKASTVKQMLEKAGL